MIPVKIKLHAKDIWNLPDFKVLLVIIVILIALINFNFDNPTYESFISGLLAGLVITLIRVIFDFKKLKLSRVVKESKLKNMLTDRNEKQYYKEILENVEKRLWVMGTSCSRLLNDFGSSREGQDEILDNLIKKNVDIQLLILDDSIIWKGKVGNLQFERYKDKTNFQVKFFKKENILPQSIFIVDDKSILGPIFTDIPSKNTTALHFAGLSEYANQYIKYFEDSWNNENNKLLTPTENEQNRD